MTSWQLKRSFGLLVVSLFINWLAVGCSEKSSSPPAGGSKDTGTKTGTETDTETDTDTDTSTATEGGDESTDPADFDLCTGLNEKADSISGFASYISELCDSGEDKNRLAGLRKDSNIYKGSGDAKIIEKTTDESDGTTVSVRLYTSTLVKAKAKDYFAMVRLQVSKPDKFGEVYEHDEVIEMSDIDASEKSSSFRYQYSDGDGNVDYNATARFYSIKTGVAYVSATKLDKSQETMKDLKGLIIVSQKDDKYTEIFTMSDQTFEVADGQDPKLYKTKALGKAKLEQKRMYNNAAKADQAAGLLK